MAVQSELERLIERQRIGNQFGNHYAGTVGDFGDSPIQQHVIHESPGDLGCDRSGGKWNGETPARCGVEDKRGVGGRFLIHRDLLGRPPVTNVVETLAMLALQGYVVTVVSVKVTTSRQHGGPPMATRKDINPETSISHLLAFYLRFLREREEMSQEDLGDFVGTDKFTVAKIEATTRHLTRQQAAKLDRRWDTGGLLVAMVGLELKERKHQARSLDYGALESEASTIKVYEATVVPALLQTPEYARALISSTGAMPDEVQERVRARLRRQELLARPRPPLLIAAIPESVLEWPVGDSEVMADQLTHLLEVGQAPNVGIRVISRSAGAHLGLDGSFTVLSGPTGYVGYTEAPGEERFTFAVDSGLYLDRFERIGFKALSDYESAALITQKREEYLDDKYRSKLAEVE